ncbi:sensor histidine kinase [Paenibacillus turpanensis]|uniref:sensor histidine kinase n=1 Tax=Paenibacillus turpanensis TaxID=2689078 RepID=UPI001408F287|nr:HAMP domain-containing sensor histidine kinase [Paenibacillus turpanensis]
MKIKSNIRMILRLAFHLAVSLMLLGFILSIGLVTAESLFPQSGDQQDLAVLIGIFTIVGTSVTVYGWYIGRPLFYIIGMIHRLASGNYTDPKDQLIFKSKDKKLKRPYHLYKEVIEQLHDLSETLETSKQDRIRLDNMQKEWIAGISHDLKTPLTYIKGYSSMLLSPQYTWNRDEQNNFLSEIQQKADHMEELIGDLNLSFRLDGQQFPVNLEIRDAVEYIRRIVADTVNDPRASEFTLTFESELSSLDIMLDEKLLQRALHNLLVNAILHNPPGTAVQVLLKKDNEHLEIRIEDNGNGMDEGTMEHLFHKYYRGTTTERHSDGTGLGMAIAYQIVLAHGGSIQVQSRLQEGTAIIVRFPLHN